MLRQIERRLEGPLVLLAFIWIGLMVAEFAGADHPSVIATGNVIWATFVVDFVVRLLLAPRKLVYLRRNWLALISLALPALRIFRLTRLLRLSRATRGLRLLRVATSLNRGTRALFRSMGRKGAGYVLALTSLVTVGGAAGMLVLEEAHFGSYWEALWWTAMMMTTMGSEYWPRSLEGRLLCLALAVYAFSVFGYVTAALASFLVERSNLQEESEPHRVRMEIAALRDEVRHLTNSLGNKD